MLKSRILQHSSRPPIASFSDPHCFNVEALRASTNYSPGEFLCLTITFGMEVGAPEVKVFGDDNSLYARDYFTRLAQAINQVPLPPPDDKSDDALFATNPTDEIPF